MTNKELIERLSIIPTLVNSAPGDKERLVEDAINDMIKTHFRGIVLSNPFKCDGYFEFADSYDPTKNGRVLIEYKYDEKMENPVKRAGVILQEICYMKKMEDSGKILPNIVVAADINEVFVLHSNPLLKYLDEDIDWTVAPSEAKDKYPDLVNKIAMDPDINPFVWNMNDPGFDFKAVAEQIRTQNATIPRKCRITEHNIEGLFKFFEKKVLNEKKISSMNTKEKVSVFIGCLIDKKNHYLSTKKINTLHTPNGDVPIFTTQFNTFFSNYADTYAKNEKKKFTEIADRLIEDTERRKSGDFWTPTIFVDYTYEMIAKVLGENWREEYVVWDCCCGTKNLTRDYHFKELYCSTLFQSELDMAKKYNPEATTFQFDFLNDDFEKLPEGLKEAFRKKKKIIFLINPPYGTGCNWDETSKTGINATKIRELMHKEKQGAGAENLQHQFMYKICKLADEFGLDDCAIGLFSKPIYLTGAKQKEFLKFYCDHFDFKDGIMFSAKHFSDTSPAWGITFGIWERGKTKDIHNFNFKCVDTDDKGVIVECGQKNLYNVWHSGKMSDWYKSSIKGMKTHDAPQLSSGVKVKQKGRGKLIDGALGYYTSVANNVCSNAENVFLLSSCASMGNGSSILPSNFLHVCSAFAARKLISGNWINDKDEYLVPDETDPKFHQFELDAVIYSLFHSSSQQASLHDIEYKGKTWNIPNHFFWMSREEIMNLAKENGNEDVYNDAYSSEDRFMYKFIQEHINEFSPEAKAVLDKASELLRKTFIWRPHYHLDHEDNQVNNWDCGYYQLKPIWKDYMKKNFDEFRDLYKNLSDKLHPMVYELGFLKK